MSQTAASPKPGSNPPTVTIDLLPKDVQQIRGYKPGDGVKVVLHGEVVEVSEREPDTSFPGSFAGTLRIEIDKVDVSQWNDFMAMTDTDD